MLAVAKSIVRLCGGSIRQVRESPVTAKMYRTRDCGMKLRSMWCLGGVANELYVKEHLLVKGSRTFIPKA